MSHDILWNGGRSMKRKKHSKSLLLLMMTLPFFSLPFMGWNSIKRFLPAALFISVFVTIEDVIAKKRKWWRWYEGIHPKLSGIVPFVWGPFIVGSLWILKLTYGKFIKYTILNLFVDSIFTYLIVRLLEKLGIGSLVRLKKYQLSSLFFLKALILYAFQLLKEKGLKNLWYR